MTSCCVRLIVEGECSAGALSEALASMDALNWHSLTPTGLHGLSSALDSIVAAAPLGSPGLASLRLGSAHVERAASAWHHELGRRADVALFAAVRAAADLSESIALRGCLCGQAARTDRTMVHSAVSHTASAMSEYVSSHRGPPVPWEAWPDGHTLNHLSDASDSLTAAAAQLAFPDR